ncbi:MAG: hypothetical protein JST63_02210 [Bacteroidetes bacterium]|nr:hypothetical protein [Bacteroidota bacterium]
MKEFISKYDKSIALIWGLLTIAFIVTAMTSETFLSWVFERHQNQISWFIRPVFLIPFCFFAFKRSWSGISITIFCLFTSMCWFDKPETISEQVKMFLQFEKDWLNAQWEYKRWLLVLTVPVSFIVLGLAFWKRSLLMGLSVVVLMATGKIVWSIYNAGEAGKAILIPAIIGLILCVILIYYGFKRLEKNKN